MAGEQTSTSPRADMFLGLFEAMKSTSADKEYSEVTVSSIITKIRQEYTSLIDEIVTTNQSKVPTAEDLLSDLKLAEKIAVNLFINPIYMKTGPADYLADQLNILRDLEKSGKFLVDDYTSMKELINCYVHVVRCVYIAYVNVLIRCVSYEHKIIEPPLLKIWTVCVGMFVHVVCNISYKRIRLLYQNSDATEENDTDEIIRLVYDTETSEDSKRPHFDKSLGFYTSPQLLFMHKCSSKYEKDVSMLLDNWQNELKETIEYVFDTGGKITNRFLNNFDLLLSPSESKPNMLMKLIDTYSKCIPEECLISEIIYYSPFHIDNATSKLPPYYTGAISGIPAFWMGLHDELYVMEAKKNKLKRKKQSTQGGVNKKSRFIFE